MAFAGLPLNNACPVNPLIRLIPPALVRFFARPYVAGDSLDQALSAADKLWRERQLLTTLDLLAEDIHKQEVADRNVATYLEMVDAVGAEGRFENGSMPTLSLKPSSYTTSPLDRGGDAAGSRKAIARIAEHARDKNVRLTVDMEGRSWTDFTLDLLEELHGAGHRHVGAVLQTRLNRTRDDLERLPPGIRVRLVIGIYDEPSSVAVRDKQVMKQRMLDYAEILLRRGHFVEFATHDEPWVRRFVNEVVPAVGVDPDAYELQMLFGVPRAKLLAEMRDRGIGARLYVPFATSWAMAVEYLRRRLDEYPAMMGLVVKNLFLRR